MASDGLAAMEQARQQKTRQRRIVPPPLHPKPTPDLAAVEATGEGPGNAAAAITSPTSIERAAGRRPPPKPGPSTGDLEKLQFYVDDHVRQFLRAVAMEVFDRNDRRLDISNSAVTRLAFRVLADHMTVTQVVDRLADTPDSGTPGRKRRGT